MSKRGDSQSDGRIFKPTCSIVIPEKGMESRVGFYFSEAAENEVEIYRPTVLIKYLTGQLKEERVHFGSQFNISW